MMNLQKYYLSLKVKSLLFQKTGSIYFLIFTQIIVGYELIF